MLTQQVPTMAPLVRYTGATGDAEQAAALAMEHGAVRITGLLPEDVAKLNRQLDRLLGGKPSTQERQSRSVTDDVRCQGLTPPTGTPSPWATPPVGARSTAK
jgi:hypothetical protein